MNISRLTQRFESHAHTFFITYMCMAVLAVAVILLASCSATGVDSKKLDTANKQLADKVVMVHTLATFATGLVQHGVITQQQGLEVATRLQQALDSLSAAQAAIATGKGSHDVGSVLAGVDKTLAAVLRLVQTFLPPTTTTYEGLPNGRSISYRQRSVNRAPGNDWYPRGPGFLSPAWG